MPLEKGATWNYSVRAGFVAAVHPVKAARRIAVGEAPGWELQSPMGNSRLAWSGRRLIADQLAGVRYSPPLPLFDPSSRKKDTKWGGFVFVGGKPVEATATISLRQDRFRVGGRDYNTELSEIKLKVGTRSIENLTWFVEGIGIVKQEQRTGPILDRALDYLSGP